jgi:sugar lactone lactonase YvrE
MMRPVLLLATCAACSLLTPLDDLGGAGDAAPEVAADAGCSPDLATDGNNCGSCGHSCLGGDCSGGVCQPVVMASGQANAVAIAVGGGYVYWTEYGAGAVRRCPVTGCGASPETVATVSGSYTMGLAIDATDAYFSAKVAANPSLGSVYRVPLDGSAQPTELATNLDHPVWMAIDSANVYWADWGDGRLMYCPLGVACASPTVVYTQTGGPNMGPNGLVSTGAALLWVSDDGNARRCTIASCTTPTVLASGLNAPTAIAVDATTAYWTNQGAASVMKCLISGCGNSPSLVASNEPGAYAVAVDASGIYWTQGTGGLVRMCPASGCTGGAVTLGSGFSQPAGIALDADAVYVAVYGSNSGTNGEVVKIAK